jgi:hypothetical protein
VSREKTRRITFCVEACAASAYETFDAAASQDAAAVCLPPFAARARFEEGHCDAASSNMRASTAPFEVAVGVVPPVLSDRRLRADQSHLTTGRDLLPARLEGARRICRQCVDSHHCATLFTPHVAAYPPGRVHRAVPPHQNR